MQPHHTDCGTRDRIDMRSRKRNEPSKLPPAGIGLEAAEWLVRLEDAESDAEEAYPDLIERQHAWLDWLGRSPEHVRAFLGVLETKRRLHGIDPQRLIRIQDLREARSADIIPLCGKPNQGHVARTHRGEAATHSKLITR